MRKVYKRVEKEKRFGNSEGLFNKACGPFAVCCSACVFAAVRPACICFVCPGRIISILKEDCGKSVGTAAASLRMGANRYPIHAICLHLFAVMDDMHFKQTQQTQQAQRHLPAAWKTARPDGLVEDFAENHKLLGGMPEAVIKPDRPEDFGRLTEYGAERKRPYTDSYKIKR